MLKEQKTNTVVFGLVVILGISLTSPVSANTVIPYTIDVWTPPVTVYNGWTYIEEISETLWLTANPSGGIIADIDLPDGTDDGGDTLANGVYIWKVTANSDEGGTAEKTERIVITCTP